MNKQDFHNVDEYMELKNLLEEYNIPVGNLIRMECIPAQLRKSLEDLLSAIEEGSISRVDIILRLSKDVQLESNIIAVYPAWDIDIKQKNGLVLEEYPELEATLDDKNKTLVELHYPVKINKNGFKYKNDYLIFPTTLSENFALTKHLINNWHGQFKLQLAFELDKLGVLSSERELLLKSHWWGPNNLTKVSSAFKSSQKVVFGTRDNSWSNELFDKVEFYFNKRDGEYHLEIEEFLPIHNMEVCEPITFRQQNFKYYMLYIHAITDETLTICTHIDGAIRDYRTKENYVLRHSPSFNSDPKKICDRYKLFRIDSNLGVSNYQEVIGLFFENNPYVHEFFSGKDERLKDIEEARIDILKFVFDNDKNDKLV